MSRLRAVETQRQPPILTSLQPTQAKTPVKKQEKIKTAEKQAPAEDKFIIPVDEFDGDTDLMNVYEQRYKTMKTLPVTDDLIDLFNLYRVVLYRIKLNKDNIPVANYYRKLFAETMLPGETDELILNLQKQLFKENLNVNIDKINDEIVAQLSSKTEVSTPNLDNLIKGSSTVTIGELIKLVVPLTLKNDNLKSECLKALDFVTYTSKSSKKDRVIALKVLNRINDLNIDSSLSDVDLMAKSFKAMNVSMEELLSTLAVLQKHPDAVVNKTPTSSFKMFNADRNQQKNARTNFQRYIAFFKLLILLISLFVLIYMITYNDSGKNTTGIVITEQMEDRSVPIISNVHNFSGSSIAANITAILNPNQRAIDVYIDDEETVLNTILKDDEFKLDALSMANQNRVLINTATDLIGKNFNQLYNNFVTLLTTVHQRKNLDTSLKTIVKDSLKNNNLAQDVTLKVFQGIKEKVFTDIFNNEDTVVQLNQIRTQQLISQYIDFNSVLNLITTNFATIGIASILSLAGLTAVVTKPKTMQFLPYIIFGTAIYQMVSQTYNTTVFNSVSNIVANINGNINSQITVPISYFANNKDWDNLLIKVQMMLMALRASVYTVNHPSVLVKTSDDKYEYFTQMNANDKPDYIASYLNEHTEEPYFRINADNVTEVLYPNNPVLAGPFCPVRNNEYVGYVEPDESMYNITYCATGTYYIRHFLSLALHAIGFNLTACGRRKCWLLKDDDLDPNNFLYYDRTKYKPIDAFVCKKSGGVSKLITFAQNLVSLPIKSLEGLQYVVTSIVANIASYIGYNPNSLPELIINAGALPNLSALLINTGALATAGRFGTQTMDFATQTMNVAPLTLAQTFIITVVGGMFVLNQVKRPIVFEDLSTHTHIRQKLELADYVDTTLQLPRKFRFEFKFKAFIRDRRNGKEEDYVLTSEPAGF